MTINLGDRVKDIYTGFEGIAVSRTGWLHGCDRISISPTTLDKDGKVREPADFDETRVEFVEAQAEANARAAFPRSILKLGDLVKDTRTGFEGVACAYTEYLHDAGSITIEPTELSEDYTQRDMATFTLARVELVRSQAVKVANASEAVKTGGPQPDVRRSR